MIYDWGKMRKLIKGGLIKQGRNVLLFHSHAKATSPSGKGKYEVLAKLSYLDQQFLKWMGDLSLSEAKSSISARFEGTHHDPISFAGDLIHNDNRYTTVASVKSSLVTAKVTGRVRGPCTYINLHPKSAVSQFQGRD